MLIPFPPYEPDRSPFNPGSGDGVLNCLPSADGWKPMLDFVEVSDALGAECKGLFFARDENENFRTFACTAADIFRLNLTGTPYSWDNFSQSAGGYSLPVDDRWSGKQFGDLLILTQLGDSPQVIDLTSGTAFADLSNAPTARYINVVGGFVVFLYIDGEPNAVQWSGLEDPEYWTDGFRHSGKQVLPTGNEIMGSSIDPAGGLAIFMRHGIHQMLLQPGSYGAFQFREVSGARGSSAPEAIVEVGDGRTFYLSDSGFYEYPTGRAIGAERVNDYFYSIVDTDYIYNTQGMLDPFEKVVWWRVYESASTYSLLGYDYQLDRWFKSDINLQASAKIQTSAITWDGLDALYATLDDVDIPYDSKFFKGGAPAYAGILSNGKLAYQTGAALAATLETSELALIEGRRAFVNGGRLIGDAGTFTAQVGRKDIHSDSIVYKSAVSPSSRTGFLPLRADGRLHQFKVSIGAGEGWTTATGIEVDAVPSGSS